MMQPGIGDADAGIVLVIEDDPSMARAVNRLVRSLGFEPRIYPCAEAFLAEAEQAEENAFCMVADIHLPGISGLELVRHWRPAGPRHIPVILTTGLEDPAYREEAKHLNCIACLIKPFESQLLVDAIMIAAEVTRLGPLDLRTCLSSQALGDTNNLSCEEPPGELASRYHRLFRRGPQDLAHSHHHAFPREQIPRLAPGYWHLVS